VETVRPRGARLGSAGAAAALTAAVAAWIAAGAGGWGSLLGAAGLVALALVAWRSPYAVAFLGAEYAAALAIAGHTRADGRAPAVAAALVAIAELVSWSRELEPEVPHERGLLLRRAARIAGTAAAAAAVAAAVLALAELPLGAGLAGDALGIAAAVAALGLVAAVARR
jgi:hypothetical protein